MGIPRIYMDTQPLIEAIKTKITKQHPTDDVLFTFWCLKAAEQKEIEIVTSIITIAECKRGIREKSPNEKTKDLIRSVLTSGAILQLSEVTLSIVEKARDLDWEHGYCFGGADGIHVATAIATNCKELLTADRMIKKIDDFNEKGFGVKIIKPHETGLLPPKYKQGNFFEEIRNSKKKQDK